MQARRREFLRTAGLGLAAQVSTAPMAWAQVPSAVAQPVEDLIGEVGYVVTRLSTILLDEAWSRDLGILEVSAANPGVDAWVPGADRLLVMPSAHILPDAVRTGIVINKAELRLYYFGPLGIETHAIGIGREGHDTPEGQTTIVRKMKDPSWYPTAETRRDKPELPAVVGPGPDNPMGDRAMYLGWPTYAMHGTNTPYGVGRRASRGCIRLYPEMARRMFDLVAIGTKVTVVKQPTKVGWHRGDLLIEVHPDFDQLDDLEESYSFAPISAPASMQDARARIATKAGTQLDRVDWRVVEAELVTRSGLPVPIIGSGTRPRAASRPIVRAPTPPVPGAPPRGTGVY